MVPSDKHPMYLCYLLILENIVEILIPSEMSGKK